MVKSMFSAEDRAKIKAAITLAEKNTSGEIVPLVVAESGSYAWIHWAYALLGVFVASAMIVQWNKSGNWPIELNEALLLQALGAGIGLLCSTIPWLKRVSIPKRTKNHHVQVAAFAHFLSEGIHHTRDHTGILIFISAFERQVHILGDKGIHEKLGQDFWHEQVGQVAAGLRSGNASDALVAAITTMGNKLAEHFPAMPGDTNELSDDLRG